MGTPVPRPRSGPLYPTRVEYSAHEGMLRARVVEITALPVIAGSPQAVELLELTSELRSLRIDAELYRDEIA